MAATSTIAGGPRASYLSILSPFGWRGPGGGGSSAGGRPYSGCRNTSYPHRGCSAAPSRSIRKCSSSRFRAQLTLQVTRNETPRVHPALSPGVLLTQSTLVHSYSTRTWLPWVALSRSPVSVTGTPQKAATRLALAALPLLHAWEHCSAPLVTVRSALAGRAQQKAAKPLRNLYETSPAALACPIQAHTCSASCERRCTPRVYMHTRAAGLRNRGRRCAVM